MFELQGIVTWESSGVIRRNAAGRLPLCNLPQPVRVTPCDTCTVGKIGDTLSGDIVNSRS